MVLTVLIDVHINLNPRIRSTHMTLGPLISSVPMTLSVISHSPPKSQSNAAWSWCMRESCIYDERRVIDLASEKLSF